MYTSNNFNWLIQGSALHPLKVLFEKSTLRIRKNFNKGGGIKLSGSAFFVQAGALSLCPRSCLKILRGSGGFFKSPQDINN